MHASVSTTTVPDTAPPPHAKPPYGGISLFTATCIVIANMIGTGVFTSLGFQVASTPSGFPIIALWLIGGVCAMCGALAYGELAATLPRSGGEYHFLSVIYHPAAGFLAGWISITVGFAAPIALAAMAFGKYFGAIFPGAPALALSIGVVVLVMLVHLNGIAVGSVFQNAATVLKIALIVVLIAAGFASTQTQPISLTPIPGDGTLMLSAPFAVSLVYVMYAYSGWNASAYIVGEVRDARRTVPLSIAIGTLLVTVLYVGVNAAFLRTTPISAMVENKVEVAHVAAQYIFGTSGGRIMAGLICAGLVSCVSAMTWIGPRVAKTMGEDWRALSWLGRTTPSGVPAVAIVCQTGLVIVLLATASFETVLTYAQFALQLCAFFTVLGLMILRYRRPDLDRPMKAWGYPITPLIFLGISLWMMWHILVSNPRESLAGLATMLLGLALYAVSGRKDSAPRVV
jgi:APA family basic amino acid/polyamine antiporter